MPFSNSRRVHFMNSVLTQPNVFSCAVDTFLEVYKSIIFPLLDLSDIGSRFNRLVSDTVVNSNNLNVCSAILSDSDVDAYLFYSREQVWCYLREKCSSFTPMNYYLYW